MIPSSVNLIPEAPVAEVVALAVSAEALGYDRCWVYDEGLATRDVYVTLAAIAAGTSTIKIGTGITNPYTRHPATTAASIATLDEMSAGRAFLGVGAGGSLTLDPLGIDRRRPLSAVGDVISACRALFSGAAVTMQTPEFELRGAVLGFARPDIEVWLAGRGPKMLELGGAVADGVMLDFIHKDVLGEHVACIDRGARRRSAVPGGAQRPRICYSTMIITDERAMAKTKPHMTYRLVDSPPQVKELLGVTEDDIARIRAAMADGLYAAAEHVKDEWVHPFVIAGDVDTCAAELVRLMREHHIDEFLLPVLELDGAAELIETVAAVLAKA